MSSLGKTLLAFALFHSVLQGHTSTGDCWTLPGKSGSVFCGVTAPSSRVLVHTTFCLCSPIVYSPILCKFWQLFGGFNVHLPQEGLCKPAASSHTQVCCTQSPCPCGSPLLTRTSTGDTQTSSVSVSVGSLGPGVHKVCLSSLSLGFDSKCEFTPRVLLFFFFHTVHGVLKARILSTEELTLLTCGVRENS